MRSGVLAGLPAENELPTDEPLPSPQHANSDPPQTVAYPVRTTLSGDAVVLTPRNERRRRALLWACPFRSFYAILTRNTPVLCVCLPLYACITARSLARLLSHPWSTLWVGEDWLNSNLSRRYPVTRRIIPYVILGSISLYSKVCKFFQYDLDNDCVLCFLSV